MRAFLFLSVFLVFLAPVQEAVIPAAFPAPRSMPLFDYRAYPGLRTGVEIRMNRTYGSGAVQSGAATKDLRADLFLPQGLRGYRKAAIIFIHGGGFVYGNKRGYRDDCRYFAERGFVAMTINYRLRRDDPPYPPDERGKPASYAQAAFVDTKTAVRWLHSHADELGIDTNNIFLDGTSAGAIASLAAGVTAPDVFATDLPGEPVPGANSPNASARVRGIIDFCGGLYGMVDSIDAGDPPILIFHGTEDRTVPFEQAMAIRERSEEVGLDHEFYPIEGAGHCPSRPAANGKDLHLLAYEFIMKRLDTRGAPGPVTKAATVPGTAPRS